MDKIDVIADKWLIDLATEKGLTWRLYEDDKAGLIKKCKSLETGNSNMKELGKIAKFNAINSVKDDELMAAVLLDEMLEGVDLDKLGERTEKYEEIRNKISWGKISGTLITNMAKNIGK
jgi:hypothetical protein